MFAWSSLIANKARQKQNLLSEEHSKNMVIHSGTIATLISEGGSSIGVICWMWLEANLSNNLVEYDNNSMNWSVGINIS